MTNTKLSNIYGFDRVLEHVPKDIETYTKEIREDIETVRAKDIYCLDKTVFGMIFCVLGIIIGAVFGIIPNKIFALVKINIDIVAPYLLYIRGLGIIIALAGFHGICRMNFSNKLIKYSKNMESMEEVLKQKYSQELKNMSSSYLLAKVKNCEECELSDYSEEDNKIERMLSGLNSEVQKKALFIKISRIVIPIILFIGALTILKNDKELSSITIAISFTIMFVFCRRLCLLLEYKVGKAIRALMCIPAIIYGVVSYFTIREQYKGSIFLPWQMVAKLTPDKQVFLETPFIMCILQVLVLILAVCWMDYYSEKKMQKEGVLLYEDTYNNKTYTNSIWYAYTMIALHIVLTGAYIYLIWNRDLIVNANTVGGCLIRGIVLGILWRVLSLIWPTGISKVITRLWGIRYSLVAEFFVIVLIATILFFSGFYLNGYAIASSIIALIVSWITFAIMNHIW